MIPGTVQICSTILKENNLLAISPGGVYEAQFGDCYYTLMWKKRLGFAKVAMDAKVVSIQVSKKVVYVTHHSHSQVPCNREVLQTTATQVFFYKKYRIRRKLYELCK